MDATLLSRLQFGFTAGFHFLFPPLTIGLSWLIVLMMTRYARSRSDLDRNLARFWTRIFALSFVIGVATGIPMEFQFGTNWAAYSRYVGDIFGAPLAAEVIFSFFLESTFLAIMIFGWDRVSIRVQWFASLMVALGATISAFWIIVANSWQQTPAGYQLSEKGVHLKSFGAAVFNPSTLPRFLHTVDGALMTGAFFVLGISAWFLLKGRDVEFAKKSFKLALVVAFITSVVQLPFGHISGRQVAATQPAKLAAFEAHYASQKRAPAIVICINCRDESGTRKAIRIPGLLSWLAKGSVEREVVGLDAFPKADRPPVVPMFFTFHLMVLLGMYFIGFTALGLWLWWRKTLTTNNLFLRAALLSIPLPFLANELGWVVAEVGRQPWVVYNLLRTKDAVSGSVSAVQIGFSSVVFLLIYALLFTIWIRAIRQVVDDGPGDPGAANPPSGSPVGAILPDSEGSGSAANPWEAQE